MSFDAWCLKFLDRDARENFKNWLVEHGFSLTIYRRNEEWWELWHDYLIDKQNNLC